ncbi:MAG: ExbD/TolR family protein [Planctomycetota bacterium]|jgi:biopolymer transport protein ExbD
MARHKKSKIEEVDADMTPMIDVTFQLIIFFICTIKFKTLEGKLETQLPKDVGVNSAPVDALLDKVEIYIIKDASMTDGFFVALNGLKMPSLGTLETKLKQMKAVNPEVKATLYPQKGVDYSMVVKVVDECIRADMLDLTFAGVAFDQ